MLQHLYAWLDRHSGWGMLAVRLAVGTRLIEGTQDNVFSGERMDEFARFLAVHGTPAPAFAAHLSAYAQFICGILIVSGLLTRAAGLVMIVNFVAALAIAHRTTPFLQTWQALMMLAAALLFLFHGAGPLSLDRALGLDRTSASRQ